ncbi:MAG: hypothetical protein JSS39_03485 [Nitrospira sp.]|nr:hypothetical protein [Nitrospira sp.]
MNVSEIWSKGTRALSSSIVVGAVLVLSLIASSHTWAGGSAKTDVYPGHLVLLPGERIVLGTVEAIEGGMIRVNVGELQPRFIPTKGAMEKGEWSLKKGDRIELAVSAENLVVDYHPVNAPGWHRIIKGQLAQPLIVGYEWAVIRTDNGKEEAFPVRPLARLKVAALPIGVPALFLIGEAGKILDATFADDEPAHRKVQEWKRSVPKASDRQLEATLVTPPVLMVTVRTNDGKEQHVEVRPFVEEKLGNLPKGKSVILLLDDENKVTDVAVPPGSQR